MKTADAFRLITEIENSIDINIFTWKNFNTWPLVRQILWVELTSVNQSHKKAPKKGLLRKIFSRVNRLTVSIINSTSIHKSNKNDIKLFISRPVYLQKLTSGEYFDRIIDPIILPLNGREFVTKYYVSKVSKKIQLSIPCLIFRPSYSFFKVSNIPSEQFSVIKKISNISGVKVEKLSKKYKEELKTFILWFYSAKKILKNKTNLEEIYLTSWYFPDMMGICAAASEIGVKTIDVQHGKQGKYQAMYSGWTKIPKDGYALMPDSFWCWGQPSCNHILESSPNRNIHIPFIGGYPWIDYYKKNLVPDKSWLSNSGIRILFTMQPPQGKNVERIPDFIVDFLLSNLEENISFIFRVHPNDLDAYSYCKRRLQQVDENNYCIDFGKSNLYDVFILSTHHITAYSSCCYEASVFGIPTLLFGEDAKDIYKDDIENGVFMWTSEKVKDLKDWLYGRKSKQNTSSFIEIKG